MLKVENLCKKYPTFCLDNVSFHIPAGVIVGFIGQNGAGKTTTLKCIMQSVLPDSGTICVNNKSMAMHEEENKQIISFTTGAFDYYRNHTLQKIANVYKTFYHDWDDEVFKKYCLKFKLDTFKRVKELSAGMRVKFALALALSHNAQLFLFDEPTSGLDPIARDEMLDVFQDIVLEGDKSILFSTHITSDLEKCADYIIYIDNGKILLACPKDELLDSHAIIKGSLDNLTEDICQRCVAVKTNKFGYTGLMKRSYLLPTDSFVTERPTVEDIMIYYNKGVQQ
ncbi:MAG: ABC transporter ATP-binding protein [Clostridia bacterium]|nr:ABC transporter ATP-binding protein [Clostridia bacterium]